MTPQKLTALGHPRRLAIFRLLMRRYPDHVAAGEIAGALDIKLSTLSAYLATLIQSGLVTQQRSGRSILYRVDMKETRQMFDHLILDCCRGRPDACAPLSTVPRRGDIPRPKLNVLFICHGNSARSIFAETILRDIAGDRFNAYSAGTRPRPALNPHTAGLLRRKGVDTRPLRAKSLAEFQQAGAPAMDFIFTVCDRAANQDGPAWPGHPICGHFSTPDPVSAQDGDHARAFQRAYDSLQSRISHFSQQITPEMNRLQKQLVVDDAAQLKETMI